MRGGRVTQLQQTQARDALEAAQAALELAEPDAPLVVVGPAEPALIERLEAAHADVRHLLPAAGAAPSALGAAQHALGVAGGERVAAVPAREPRPLRSRRWLQVCLGLAALAALVLGLDLLTAAQLRAAVDAHARVEGGLRAQRLQAKAAEQRGVERDALAAEVAALEAEQADAQSGARRGAELVALVDALARAAPADLILEQLDDRGDAVTLVGRCGSPSAVQVFLDDLARDLAPRGLTVALRRVTRDDAATTPAYRFEARLEGGAE